MTQQSTATLYKAVDHLKNSAEKVEDGINNVLEPEIKDARISSDDTRQIMKDLNRKVVILFSVSILLNAATLAFVLLK